MSCGREKRRENDKSIKKETESAKKAKRESGVE